MRVRDVMTSTAHTVRADILLGDAFAAMREHGCRRLPVVTEAGQLQGIVTERDLYRAAARFHEAPVEIGEIMTRDVLTITAEAHIQDAARLMMEKRISGLPVIDDLREVVGVVTETDIFKVFVGIMEAEDEAGTTARHGNAD